MLSGGLRLALLVGAPLAGALAVHELRHHLRMALLVTLGAVAASGALALSLAGGVSGGGSVERTFGNAIPGVDLTARADAASIMIITISVVAALFALPRSRASRERLTGLLLCVAGSGAVAVAGNLVLVAAGVEVIAGGALLLGGRRGPGRRATVLLTMLIGVAALGLVAAAAELVARSGSSDLAAIPPTSVGGAIAVPWALAGAALLVSPVVLATSVARPRDWPAVATVPAGFLVLLRLQQTAGGQVPGNAAVMLGVVGALVALAGGRAALRATTVADAARAATAVLTGLVISLFGGDLAGNGVPLAGLFVGLELALLASAAWNSRPTAWSVASAALVAVPGGATGAVVLVSLGGIVVHGPTAFLQVGILAAAIMAAAVGVARRLADPPQGWRPLSAGAIVAVAGGLAGGLVPGVALHSIAAPLATGAQRIDLDAGTLQHAGAAWAGGYFAAAVLLVLATAASAVVLVGEERVSPPPLLTRALPAPRIAGLLHLRRRVHRPQQRALGLVRSVDHWLDVQPQLALIAVAAVVGVLVLR